MTQCDNPYLAIESGQKINGKIYHEDVHAPCGKCPNCKRKRINQWVFRLLQEEEVHASSFFVTLTYNTKNVPLTPRGFMTLDKKNVQDFLKRLRKKQPDTPIKYYYAGEYGSDNNRPHYHMIIFGVTNKENIHEAWQLGDIHIGNVKGASIAYTAKYIDKPKRIPLHRNDDRLPEYSNMSQGIGKNYLTEAKKKWHKENIERNYVVTPDGIKVSIPKYYRDKIYNDKEKAKQRDIILEKINEEKDKKIRKYGYEKHILAEANAKIARVHKFKHSQSKKR